MSPSGGNEPDVPYATRLERRLDAAVARATTPRGAAIVIAVASITVTVAAGLVMTVVDRGNYPTIGEGLWWAIQTTTTVGYGDNVPTTVAGRFVAAVVMLFGLGILTVITAAITTTFVTRSRIEQLSADATDKQLRQLSEQLERIEAALTRRP